MERQNNKQKLQILEAPYIRNIKPKLNRINFETSANVLKCLYLLMPFLDTNSKGNATQYNSINAHSYKVVIKSTAHHLVG